MTTQSQMEELLTAYYGVSLKDDAELAAEQHDLNSRQFDAPTFVNAVLGDLDLRQLVDIDNDMVSDIKALDSEQQMLVYENYTHFISATDMIQDMKGHVDSMEAEMTALSKRVQEVKTLSQELNEELNPARAKLQKLVQLRNLLFVILLSHSCRHIVFVYFTLFIEPQCPRRPASFAIFAAAASSARGSSASVASRGSRTCIPQCCAYSGHSCYLGGFGSRAGRFWHWGRIAGIESFVCTPARGYRRMRS